MRVNLGLEMPIASLTLTDTGTEATTVYLAHNLPEPRYDEALAQLMKTQGVQHMTWRPGDRLQPCRVPGNPLSSAARRRLIERSRGHNDNRRQDDGRRAADSKCGRHERSERLSSHNLCLRVRSVAPARGIWCVACD